MVITLTQHSFLDQSTSTLLGVFDIGVRIYQFLHLKRQLMGSDLGDDGGGGGGGRRIKGFRAQPPGSSSYENMGICGYGDGDSIDHPKA